MDELYKDRNGVQWKLIVASSAVIASPDPESPRKYAELPADLGPINAQAGDRPGARELTMIKQVVEAYASQHKGDVELEVRAKPGNQTVWVLVGAGLLLLYWGAPKRRRRR